MFRLLTVTNVALHRACNILVGHQVLHFLSTRETTNCLSEKVRILKSVKKNNKLPEGKNRCGLKKDNLPHVSIRHEILVTDRWRQHQRALTKSHSSILHFQSGVKHLGRSLVQPQLCFQLYRNPVSSSTVCPHCSTLCGLLFLFGCDQLRTWLPRDLEGRNKQKIFFLLYRIHRKKSPKNWAPTKTICVLKIQQCHLTNYTSQDLRWELRFGAIVSGKCGPPALQRVCGQCFSIKKYHQQCWRVLLVVSDLCDALVKTFWYSKILSKIQEVVLILRTEKTKKVSYKLAECDAAAFAK